MFKHEESESKTPYPACKKKWGTLEGSMGIEQQEESTIRASDVLKPDFDLEQLKADTHAREEQRQRDLESFLESKIFSPIFGSMMHFEYPVKSVQRVLKKSEGWSMIQMGQEIELTDVEIERRQEAKKIRAATYTKEKIEHALWNHTSISFETKSEGRTQHFYVHTIEDAEQLLALEKEAQQILNARIGYFTAIKRGYEARLRAMKKAAPKILINKLCEIRKVVKESAKPRENMVKIAANYRKRGSIDGKEAIRYQEDKERFAALQSQYHNLHSEIIKYRDSSDLKIPQFPASLNMDERIGEIWILEHADRERKSVQNIPSGLPNSQ
jgi:hypothetical protein